jgi:hypothetical protein
MKYLLLLFIIIFATSNIFSIGIVYKKAYEFDGNQAYKAGKVTDFKDGNKIFAYST